MVKRNMFAFLVVILMVLFFSAGSIASKYEFTMGYHVPRSHLLGNVVQKFAEFVEEETNGEATLKIFPARELGDQRELVDGMIIGTIDMSINSTDYLSSVIPEMGIFDLPFLWNDYDHLEKAITGNPGNKLKELMIEKSGIRALDFLFTDFRKFYLTKKIDSFRELKGMDIRVPEAKVYIDTIVALDANPHAIPGGDIITSLNTGLIQGYEGEPASAYTSGFAAAARNSLETNHIFTAIVLNMSNKVYESLPEDIQKGINRAAERAGKWGRAYAIEVETDFYQKIKDEMLETVTTVSDADKEELKLITKPIHKELLDSVNINDIYEEIVSLGKK
jgi:tripartite ATP-independent transporter DctP family solute receptor